MGSSPLALLEFRVMPEDPWSSRRAATAPRWASGLERRRAKLPWRQRDRPAQPRGWAPPHTANNIAPPSAGTCAWTINRLRTSKWDATLAVLVAVERSIKSAIGERLLCRFSSSPRSTFSMPTGTPLVPEMRGLRSSLLASCQRPTRAACPKTVKRR